MVKNNSVTNLFSSIPYNFNNQTYSLKVFPVNELPSEIHNKLLLSKKTSLHPAYLNIKHQEDQPVFVFCIKLHDEIISLTSIYKAKVDLKLSGKDLTKNRINQWLYDYVAHPLFENKTILFLGSLFISGDSGSYFYKTIETPYQFLLDAFTEWNMTTQQFHNSIGWVGLDIRKTEPLEQNGKISIESDRHIRLNFEPVMEIDLGAIESFDHYKSLLKAKFRTKLNKAKKASNNLTIRQLTHLEIEQNINRIGDLFQQVTNRSSYIGGDFNIEDLIEFNKQFENNYITGFFLNETLVGFSTSIIDNTTFVAHMIGMDYSVSKSVSLYETILYHFIEVALATNCTNLNFGRTAIEIKSGVGASPAYYFCSLQFNRCWWQAIGKKLAKKLQLNLPELRKAFKKNDIEATVAQ